jgi:hypothetical protein
VLYLKQDNNNVIYSNLLSRGYEEATSLGIELVKNGDFATDSDWIKGTGWSIASGKAKGSATTTNLQQLGILQSGKTYKLTFKISDYVSGSVKPNIGTVNGTIQSSNGTFTEYITSFGSHFYFDGVSAFTGSIDNVSIKEFQINTFSWLINITNDFTKERTTLLQLVDNSVNITPGTNTVSYPIKVLTSGTANGLNQEVLLKNTGYYSYEIYKQDSLTNLDVNNAVVGKLVESGKALVYNDTKEVNYKEQADGNPNNFIYVP